MIKHFPNVSLVELICVCMHLHSGGFNQQGFLSSVECYCPERNEWTVVTEMPVGRSGMGVAVTMEPCPGSLPEQEEDEDGAS